MKIALDNGGTVELLWTLSPERALWYSRRAVSPKYCGEDDSRAVRDYMRLWSPTTVTFRTEEEFRRKLDEVLRSGELLAAIDDGLPMFSNAYGVQLCRWPLAIRVVWKATARASMITALTWLDQIGPDQEIVTEIGRFLKSASHGADLNGGALDELKASILTGEAIVLMERQFGKTSPGLEGKLPDTPSAPLLRPEKEELPDEPTFSSGHAPSTQAAALMSAAQSGVPFCEVCRAAASR